MLPFNILWKWEELDLAYLAKSIYKMTKYPLLKKDTLVRTEQFIDMSWTLQPKGQWL